MNPWATILWLALMLGGGMTWTAMQLVGYHPGGYAASTHDDPSPGPNGLF